MAPALISLLDCGGKMSQTPYLNGCPENSFHHDEQEQSTLPVDVEEDFDEDNGGDTEARRLKLKTKANGTGGDWILNQEQVEHFLKQLEVVESPRPSSDCSTDDRTDLASPMSIDSSSKDDGVFVDAVVAATTSSATSSLRATPVTATTAVSAPVVAAECLNGGSIDRWVHAAILTNHQHHDGDNNISAEDLVAKAASIIKNSDNNNSANINCAVSPLSPPGSTNSSLDGTGRVPGAKTECPTSAVSISATTDSGIGSAASALIDDLSPIAIEANAMEFCETKSTILPPLSVAVGKPIDILATDVNKNVEKCTIITSCSRTPLDVGVASRAFYDQGISAVKANRIDHHLHSLLRRMRQFHATRVTHHVATQLSQLSSHPITTAQRVQALQNDPHLEEKVTELIRNGELNGLLKNGSELKNLPAATLVKLIRKFDASKLSAAGTSNSSHLTSDVHLVSRLLQSRLGFTRRYPEIDSDATDSSSEADSADEHERPDIDESLESLLDTDDVAKTPKLPLSERASWRWWTHRNWIGSRWHWTQAQITDLEIRVRQFADACRQIQELKPPIQLEGEPQHQHLSLESLHQNDHESTTTVQTEFGKKESILKSETIEQSSETCARIRPLDRTKFKNRRVINTAGMFRWNRLTMRQATVFCRCSPPQAPCVLCSGRVNSVDQVIDVCNQSVAERVALLDHDYHIVLRPEKSAGFRGEDLIQACLKSGSTARPAMAKKKRKFGESESVSSSAVAAADDDEHSKKHCSSSKPENASSSSSSKTKNHKRVDDENNRVKEQQKERRKRKISAENSIEKEKEKIGGKRKFQRGPRIRAPGSRSSSGSVTPAAISPLTLGRFESTSSDKEQASPRIYQRRVTNQFDINNIIIDPNVAAPLKIEKIPYKEIKCPGWRIVDYYDHPPPPPTDEPDGMETVTVAQCELRHAAKEAEEKQRNDAYMQWLLNQSHGRKNCSLSHSNSNSSANSSTAGSSLAVPDPQPLSYVPYPPRKFPLSAEDYEETLSEEQGIG